MPRATVRSALAARLPRPLVDAYRWLRLAFPTPPGDLAQDLADLVRPRRHRLPPAGLRQKVGLTPTRAEYAGAGAVAAAEIRAALAGLPARAPGRWLDFGCGCGRIARHLLDAPECGALLGVDVDLDSVRWCERHLAGRFRTISPRPPMALSDGDLDVVIAASVFTHLDESAQLEWLREIRRLLRPGGVLVASTHGPALHVERADLPEEERRRLDTIGFAFVAPRGHFNTGTAYHSRAYLERTWGSLLRPARWVDRGLFRIQDLSVWRREES